MHEALSYDLTNTLVFSRDGCATCEEIINVFQDFEDQVNKKKQLIQFAFYWHNMCMSVWRYAYSTCTDMITPLTLCVCVCVIAA